jgi:hypothetical protein
LWEEGRCQRVGFEQERVARREIGRRASGNLFMREGARPKNSNSGKFFQHQAQNESTTCENEINMYRLLHNTFPLIFPKFSALICALISHIGSYGCARAVLTSLSPSPTNAPSSSLPLLCLTLTLLPHHPLTSNQFSIMP